MSSDVSETRNEDSSRSMSSRQDSENQVMIDDELITLVGQLVVAQFDGLEVTDYIRTLIKTFRVGNIFLTKKNIRDAAQLAKLTSDLQKEAKEAGHALPLMICIDQENGIVRQKSLELNLVSPLGDGHRATQFPSAMAIGAMRSRNCAYDIAKASSRELAALGIKWNFAPVVDIFGQEACPPPMRSFSDQAVLVAHLACGYIEGLRNGARVASCAKYFPLLGPNSQVPRISVNEFNTNPRDENKQFYPFFKASWESGHDSVMLRPFATVRNEMQHIPHTVRELLRTQLGFIGLIIFDCSEAETVPAVEVAEAGVYALASGVDMLVFDDDERRTTTCIEEIYRGLTEGRVHLPTLQISAQRVKQLKAYYNSSWNMALNPPGVAKLQTLMREHKELSTKLYARSITIERMKPEKLYQIRNLPPNGFIALFTPVIALGDQMSADPAERLKLPDPFECFGKQVRRFHGEVRHMPYFLHEPMRPDAVGLINLASAVIFVTCSTLPKHENQSYHLAVLYRQLSRDKPFIAMATGSPRDLLFDESFDNYVCTYDYTPPALIAAASVIFGENPAQGIIPISRPTSHARTPPRQWKVEQFDPAQHLSSVTEILHEALGHDWSIGKDRLKQILGDILNRPGTSQHYVVQDPSTNPNNTNSDSSDGEDVLEVDSQHPDVLGFCATYSIRHERNSQVASMPLLVVRNSHRNFGIGKSLHMVALRDLERREVVKLTLGSFLPRIIPGIPTEPAPADMDWLIRRGWKTTATQFCDLQLQLRQWQPPIEDFIGVARRVGITIEPWIDEKTPNLILFVERYFLSIAYPGWVSMYQKLVAAKKSGSWDILIAEREGIVVGTVILYSAFDPNPVSDEMFWPRLMPGRIGGLTCLAIHPAHHNETVGMAILTAAIMKLQQMQMDQCFVDGIPATVDWFWRLQFGNYRTYREAMWSLSSDASR